MNLLFLKTKQDATEFSRDFYDRKVFCSDPLAENSPPDPTGGKPFSILAGIAQRLASERDASFGKVPLSKLIDELLALRLEMIGTAWTDKSNESAALANSAFTRQYLTEIGRSDLWDVMGKYSEIVTQSAIDPGERSSRMGRAKMVFVNGFRADLFDKLYAQGHDPETMSRVVKRSLWRNSNKTFAMLAIRLVCRLDFNGSESVVEPLAAVTYGFYRGAKSALRGVKLTA